MSDSVTLAVTGATRAGFGSVRVMASIGWAISVLASGWLIERYGLQIAFWGMFLCTASGALFIAGIHPQYFSRPQADAPQPGAPASPLSPGLRQVAGVLLRDPAMVGLALMLVVVGLGNSGVAQFDTVYLDMLGASEGLIGIAGMASSVVEIPCMLLADSLVRRHGPLRLLQFAMLMTLALRGLVFAFPSVTAIIAARAIGGISFSMYAVALIRYISEHAPAGQTRSALALFNVTLASLIAILANPFAGRLFDLLGAHWLYLIAMGGYLMGWVSLKIFSSNSGVVPGVHEV
jgi:PPP family 3-phenylpropionic acid transporter